MNHIPTVVFAGGGTGGHIFPAIAVAEQLNLLTEGKVRIIFVGAQGGLEEQIIPRQGYPLHLLPVGKLNYRGQWVKKLKTLLQLPWVLVKALVLRWRLHPQVVVGMGGYASAPMVLVAALTGGATMIWEANATPGLANRWLSRWVNLALIVFPEARRLLSARHIEQLGMPVRVAVDEAWVKRSSLLNAPTSDSIRSIQEGSLDGAQASIFTFFVFGGSQGARALNRVVFELVKQHSQDLRQQGIRIVHQIGRHDWQEAQACYAGLSSEWLEYHEFIQDMPRYYEQADVVMCRAGASSVAEVMAFGLVTIFVPLPLADSHQKANAQSLVEAGAALMIEQKELTVEKLFASLLALKHDPSKRRAMQKKMLELYRPRASVKMAELILQVCRHEI